MAQPYLLSVCPPPAKISALAAKNLAWPQWPALHESRCFRLLVFCYQNIVTVIVKVVLVCNLCCICEYRTTLMTLFACFCVCVFFVCVYLAGLTLLTLTR